MGDLNRGVLLEDSKQLLKWDSQIDELATLCGANKEERGDRTIYHWGEHSIFEGLTVRLQTQFWDEPGDWSTRKFVEVDSWSFDEAPHPNFERISNHLIQQLGEPARKEDDDDGDRYWLWEIETIEVSLSLFLQHAYKLCLSVRKK